MNLSYWYYLYLPRLMNWFEVLLYCVGLGLMLWAYWRSRKLGYLVLALYAFLVIWTLSIWPAIRSARLNRWYAEHRLPPEQEDQYHREFDAIHLKYFKAIPPGPSRFRINVPVGPFVLITGLWLLLRTEDRRKAQSKGGDGSATAPPPSPEL